MKTSAPAAALAFLLLTVSGAPAQEETKDRIDIREVFSREKSAAGANGEVFVLAHPDQVMTGTILGAEIYDDAEENAEFIGTVEDIIVSPDGRVLAVLTTVGGLAGVGAKSVAISFEILKWRVTDRGRRRLIADLTRARIEQAPPFQLPALKKTAVTWQKSETIPIGQAGLTLTELLKMPLIDRDDKNAGEVTDVLFTTDGRVDALVVDVGGLLGLGETQVALPFESLSVRRTYPKETWQTIRTPLSGRQLEILAGSGTGAKVNRAEHDQLVGAAK